MDDFKYNSNKPEDFGEINFTSEDYKKWKLKTIENSKFEELLVSGELVRHPKKINF